MKKAFNTIGIQDLSEDTAYYVCPNPDCEEWENPNGRNFSDKCFIGKCPNTDELRKFFYCDLCSQIIELQGNHNSFQRVNHAYSAAKGDHIFMFEPSRYLLIHKMPE